MRFAKLDHMRTDDGYVHAWTIDAELAREPWEALHAEIVAIVRAASMELERGRSQDLPAILRGPSGMGGLSIDPGHIAFNGNSFLGQSGDAFSIERSARSGIIARMGAGGGRRTVRRCATSGHPYDLAVCASLLVLLRQPGIDARVGTSGSLRAGWAAAAALVRKTLGNCGQLVQLESGLLRWVDAPASSSGGRIRSSAS